VTEVGEAGDSEALPPGVMLMDDYRDQFYDMLKLDNQEIPRPYFLSLPPKSFKTICTLKVSSSLLAFPVFQCFLKFDGRFTMSAQKGILGKYIICQRKEPKENEDVLAKLSSNLTKDLYKLY